MKNIHNVSAVLAVSVMSCGGMVDDPLSVDMTMNGYRVSCAAVTAAEGMTPLNKDYYCGKGEETAEVVPSIYRSYAAEIRDALNCALEGLVAVNVNNDIHQAPNPETLFIGGIAQDVGSFGEYSGKTVTTSDGHFYGMVVDRKPNGEAEPACEVMITLLHELGHGLENTAILKGATFSTYGLDEHGHDPYGTDAVMMSGATCKTSLNFSEKTATLIAETLHPGNARPEKLKNISERCAVQLERVNGLPTP